MRRTRGEKGSPQSHQHQAGSYHSTHRNGTVLSQRLLPSQILDNWRNKRVIDPQTVDDVLSTLDTRSASLDDPQESPSAQVVRSAPPGGLLSRSDIFKRIEEDRERHKRLRERRWVQPVSRNPAPHLPPQLASFLPFTDDRDGEEELAIDIEFENEWETTSDWNEDDEEAANEENNLCFPVYAGEVPMDLL